MKKRLLAILLSLTMAAGLVPTVALAVEPHVHQASVDCETTGGTQVTFTAWGDAAAEKTSLPTTAGNYYLTDDVALGSSWNVPNDGAMTLCLNGHKITSTAVIAFELGGSADLTICDCNGSDGTNTFTSPVTNETVSVTGGLITGATAGAINVYYDGKLCLYGGTIAGNGAAGNGEGGGVKLQAGTPGFEMHGGKIMHNKAMAGGGIEISSGSGVITVDITGGEISDNLAQGGDMGGLGGGIYPHTYGSGSVVINLSGGTIRNNTAGSGKGGGIPVFNSTTLNISGAPNVTGNIGNGVTENIRLNTGKTINVIAPLTAGADIGITTQSSPTASTAVTVTGDCDSDVHSYFTSDNSSFETADGEGSAAGKHVVKLQVPAPTTYTVTFTGGTGAEGTAPTQADTAAGGSFTLPANTFTKTGLSFSGWDDGTSTYNAGDTYTMPAQNVTFTAQWTDVTAPAMVSAVLSGSDAVFTFSEAIDTSSVSVTYGGGAVSGGLTWSSGNTVLTAAGVGEGDYSIVCSDVAGNSATLTGTVSDGKAAQTITAADVNAVYGDTGKKITVTSTNYGALSYGVKSGSAVSVDAAGNLTIVGVGTAVITVSAAGDATHKSAAKDVTVTVSPKSIAAPAADPTVFTYNGTAQTYAPVGGDTAGFTVSGNVQTAANEAGYTVTAALKDKTNTQWADGTAADKTFPFIIKKATVTVTAKDQSIYTGADAPDLSAPVEGTHYTVDGLVTGDALVGSVVMEYEKDGVYVLSPDTAVVGVYDIAVKGVTEPAGGNYNPIVLTKGTLTVSSRPSSGSTSVAPTYTASVSKESSVNGNVSLSGKKSVAKGSTVTFTVTPDPKYKTVAVTVTDAKGNVLQVTEKNGKYEFTMPGSKVDISADFAWDNPFTDVAEKDWYHDSVEFCHVNDIMEGVGSGSFAPAVTTTRGMVMTMLARLAGEDTSAGAAWYEAGMNWAKEMGISDGTSPEGDLTREQLATMLYRYEKLIKKGGFTGLWMFDLDFTDTEEISDWAGEAMHWMVMKGVITGKGGAEAGTLDPKGTATRAEIATMFSRYLKLEG